MMRKITTIKIFRKGSLNTRKYQKAIEDQLCCQSSGKEVRADLNTRASIAGVLTRNSPLLGASDELQFSKFSIIGDA